MSTTPEHQSETCLILRGVATRTYKHVLEDEEVVIKLMRIKEHYRREIDARKKLGEDSVVGIVASSEDADISDRWASDVEKRRYGDYPFGIVMKAAQRNVMVILVRAPDSWIMTSIFSRALLYIAGSGEAQLSRYCQYDERSRALS